ncbi:MAG: MOSC domain-containing protein YiiM [Patiriisocius sp.]|jgi:MOSC domain-containing protein YiiM
MKVISTNISDPREMIINGEKRMTGIFKKAVNSIYLGTSDVRDDNVMNRKHHGGPEKACYVFSTDHYAFWKDKYPELEWEWGMFGENISIEGWDESKIKIGDVYNVGETQVEVSSPRIPCNFLSTKFKNEMMLGEYLHYNSPGTYLRVLKEGNISVGDEFKLVKSLEETQTVLEIYSLLRAKKNHELYDRAINNEALSEEYKKSVRKKYTIA